MKRLSRIGFIAAFMLSGNIAHDLPAADARQPNILFCISDDQSYAHTGAHGDPVVQTPAFDRIAREGLRFTHAFCDAPTCGPSRSAILTGQPIWRLEEAGNIHSTLPAKFATYTERLKEAGYSVGYTGKGWGPGNWKISGRTRNPAGENYSQIKSTETDGYNAVQIGQQTMQATSGTSSSKCLRTSRFASGWEHPSPIAVISLGRDN